MKSKAFFLNIRISFTISMKAGWLLPRTLKSNFNYLQEMPILTLDVNEDFRDKHQSPVERAEKFRNTL